MSMNLVYSVREGFRGLGRARGATALSVSTMTIALTLMGVFLVLTVNVQRIVRVFRDRLAVEVFFDPAMGGEDRDRLESALEAIAGVSEVVYVSAEEALNRFREELGEDPVEILGENPLPASYQVFFGGSGGHSQSIGAAVETMRGQSGVEDVVYRSRLFQAVEHYSRIILLVDGALFLLVFLAAIVLVANTLRLTILSQREMIKIMESVGATRGFIRRPYTVQGIVQGGLAGLLASLVVFILVKLVSMRFEHLIDDDLLFLLPLAIGLVLGWIGSHIALLRFMRA